MVDQSFVKTILCHAIIIKMKCTFTFQKSICLATPFICTTDLVYSQKEVCLRLCIVATELHNKLFNLIIFMHSLDIYIIPRCEYF